MILLRASSECTVVQTRSDLLPLSASIMYTPIIGLAFCSGMTSLETAEGANEELEVFSTFMLDGSVLVLDEGQALGMAHFCSAAEIYLTSVHRLLLRHFLTL